MADDEEAQRFSVRFTLLMLFSKDFKWVRVKMQEYRKGFKHAACGLVFKHLPRDPSNV